MKTDVMFSSKSAEWMTPPDFYKRLDNIFHFTLDPASTPENALCRKFFTIEDNGLEQSWYGERTFLNPPYGREIINWVKKAHDEIEYAFYAVDSSPCPAREPRTLIVVLLPARTDTIWMHKYVYHGATWLIDIKGRLKFDNPLMDWDEPSSAPFPSRLAVYGSITDEELYKLSKFGQVVKPVTLKKEGDRIICPELS